MTSYGTIPTSAAAGASSDLDFVSRAKRRLNAGLATRAPWKLMFDLHSFTLPLSFRDSIARIKINAAYFRMNYAMIALVILFLSLLWFPISLIVFTAMLAVWLFLYFLRDEPLVVFRRQISDLVVLAVLAVLTLVFLFLTKATVNIVVAVVIGGVVVVAHAAARRTDDLFLDDEAAAGLNAPGSYSISY